MTIYRVTTPVDGYTAAVGDVQFVNGVAEVDDQTNPGELGYFRNAGYGVEEIKQQGRKGKSADPAATDLNTPAPTDDAGGDNQTTTETGAIQ